MCVVKDVFLKLIIFPSQKKLIFKLKIRLPRVQLLSPRPSFQTNLKSTESLPNTQKIAN